jgi:hypothetical protein
VNSDIDLFPGGEIPINSSIALAEYIQREVPEFYQALLEKGVRYIYRYSKETVQQSNVGNGVIGAYGQEVKPDDDIETVKMKVEKEVERHSYRWEWHEDGSISVTHIVPRKCILAFTYAVCGLSDNCAVIRKLIPSGKATFFGNLTSAYG